MFYFICVNFAQKNNALRRLGVKIIVGLDPTSTKILKKLRRKKLTSLELIKLIPESEDNINESLKYLKNEKKYIIRMDGNNTQHSIYKITVPGKEYLHACKIECFKYWYPHIISTMAFIVAIVALFKSSQY